jgi:hypothetical protein
MLSHLCMLLRQVWLMHDAAMALEWGEVERGRMEDREAQAMLYVLLEHNVYSSKRIQRGVHLL